MSTAQTAFRAKASSNEGKDYELPPTGQQIAVLVGLIDLGTSTRVFQGKSNDVHKVLFCWELTTEQDSKGANFVVAQDFTWSLNKKANLRALLEGWVGRTFQEDEEYDFGGLLGTGCMINLTDGLSSGGKKFVEVASVARPMKGMSIPAATYPPFAFLVEQMTSCASDPPIPDWVPMLYGRRVIDDIKASHEWGKLPPF